MAKKSSSPMPLLVGAQVRAARKAAGLTQQALADRLKSSRGYVSVVEAGCSGLSLDQLSTIAAALGVEPGSLLPTLERIREVSCGKLAHGQES